MDTIGLRIAHYLMLKNGGNQSELARYCGVSPQAVQKWIAGISEPRGKNFEKTAEFLGISEVILKFGKNSTKLEEFSRDFISSPIKKSATQESVDVTPTQRQIGSVAIKTEACDLHYVTEEEMRIIFAFRATDIPGKASITAAAVSAKKSDNISTQRKVAV